MSFHGEIDVSADFSELVRRLRGRAIFRLSEIHRINSIGVREWVNFVSNLPGVTDLTFTHCAPAIVRQLNMIDNFRAGASIRSFYAPYTCETCRISHDKLVDVSHLDDDGLPPEAVCSECKGPLLFDEDPERYLGFLEHT